MAENRVETAMPWDLVFCAMRILLMRRSATAIAGNIPAWSGYCSAQLARSGPRPNTITKPLTLWVSNLWRRAYRYAVPSNCKIIRHLKGSREWCDREARRQLSPLVSLPHLDIRRLDVPPKAVGVKEWPAFSVAGKLLPDFPQPCRVTRQLQGQRLVLVERVGNQFRQPDRAQQACRHPSRERRSHAGKYRQSCPQGIAGRGVRVVGQGIQEQVREPMPRQVMFGRDPGGKDQSVGIDAPRRRFLPQIALRRCVTFEQP